MQIVATEFPYSQIVATGAATTKKEVGEPQTKTIPLPFWLKLDRSLRDLPYPITYIQLLRYQTQSAFGAYHFFQNLQTASHSKQI